MDVEKKEFTAILPLKPVKSSNLEEVGYDPELQILMVQFTGGRIYRYSGVPEEVYRELMASPSMGRFFHQNIRSRFQYQEISPQDPVLETFRKIFDP